MEKRYYCSNVASIATAISSLNSTYNVATFYDSHTYIELLDDGSIDIYLDIQGIINANTREPLAIIDANCNHVATCIDYWDVVDFLEEDEGYRVVIATGEYDIYL